MVSMAVNIGWTDQLGRTNEAHRPYSQADVPASTKPGKTGRKVHGVSGFLSMAED